MQNFNETANPAPLGLAGFGMATILLNIHNAGFYGMDSMIMAMGLLIGGLVQIIVGSWEWKKNNMFGMMAFSGYGFFWVSLVCLTFFPKMGLIDAPSATAMGCYLTVWAIFTLGLCIATLKHAKIMQVLFFLVFILFGLLALNKFTGSHAFHTAAGFEGILCGSLALYISLATVINNEFGKNVLPL